LIGWLTPMAAWAKDDLPKAPLNGDFEEGEVGMAPPGWFMPLPSANAGYTVQVTEDQPHAGKRCAILERKPGGEGMGFGNIMQTIDATRYRGKRIRYQAAVRAEGRAQLWLRVDRKDEQAGFFDNMGDRPITSGKWMEYTITGDVDKDAETINFGLMLIGNGKTWIDAVKLEVVGDAGEGIEPPRPLQGRELDNLVAYARLLGLVRYFHPSDQAAGTDWDQFAIHGVAVAQSAKTPAELAQKLEELFRPIAPLVHVFPTGQKPVDFKPVLPEGVADPKIVAWRHVGVGLSLGIYSSARVSNKDAGPLGFGRKIDPKQLPDPSKPLTVDLGAGVTAVVPLALYADDKGTLPHAPPAKQTPSARTTAKDRNTRLAAVALCWNVFQHFYPYFDVVDADWPAALRTALTKAATDADERAFLDTLRALVAAARDGHGNVMHPADSDYAMPPFRWDWIEKQLVITQVGDGVSAVKPGDIVVKVNGVPAADALAEKEKLISGATPQWRRYRGLTELLRGRMNSTLALTVRNRAGNTYETSLRRNLTMDAIKEPRLAKVAELKPGVMYFNLDEAVDADFKAALPKLAKADGIIFDLRGYPRGSTIALSHLIDRPVTCAQWHIPVAYYPDHAHVAFDFSNWPVPPQAPRFKAKVAFLTDGRAISYAETYLGIVEHYKLGDIVGSPTAGTNGNINPFTLPGGYRVVFTGMKVLKHDGSQHHGIGIQPTVPVTRTIAGVVEGKDEVLERAVDLVSRQGEGTK
jgi:C-terminal processing protease CtpA/Prc